MTGLSLLRTEIHEGSVWPLLRGVVRQRVPAADVDDAVQATAAEYMFAVSAIEPQGEASAQWHLSSPSSGNATLLVEIHGDTATVTVSRRPVGGDGETRPAHAVINAEKRRRAACRAG